MELLLSEDCPECCWNEEKRNPLLEYLLEMISLEEAGKPLHSDDLTDHEWIIVGELKKARSRLPRAPDASDGWQTVPQT